MARLIELTGHTLRVAANRKSNPAQAGHCCEHRFIGDIVADENRPAAEERFVRHQLADAGRLVET